MDAVQVVDGMDAAGRELYLKAIYDELSRGASVVLATHDIQDEAALCHQVMLLARKVIAELLHVDVRNVSVKAKTLEGLGAVGTSKAVAAHVGVILYETPGAFK